MNIKPVLRYHLLPILIIIPVILLVPCTLKVFPSMDFKWHNYDDSHVGGNSAFYVCSETAEGIDISYIIGNDYDNPFVGISFQPVDNCKLNSWDYLNIEIESEGIQTSRIFLKAFVDGVSDNNETLSHAHYLTEIPLSTHQQRIKIALKDIHIPAWWYAEYHLDRFENQLKLLRNNFSMIDWQSGKFKADKEGSLIIKKIYFSRNPFGIILPATLIIVLWYAGWILFHFLSAKVRIKIEFLTDGSIKPRLYSNEALIPMIAYIGEHYCDPDITLKSVCASFHCSTSWLSVRLKKTYGLSFPRYVNHIRVHEAKRLLQTTALNITEIADALGFGDSSTFSRVFASICGISPRTYRNSLQKSADYFKNA